MLFLSKHSPALREALGVWSAHIADIGPDRYGKNSPQKKYNNKILENKIHDAKLFDRQALHSSKISFVHPTKNKLMSFKSELPSDIKNLIKKLS